MEKRIYRIELSVEPQSNLDGKTLERAGFAQPVGYALLSISRAGAPVAIAPTLELCGGDVLSIAASSDVLPQLWTTIGLLPLHTGSASTPRHQRQLVEVVVSSRSPAVGRLVSELPLPDSPYAAAIVGGSHDGQAPPGPLGDYRGTGRRWRNPGGG